MEFLRAALGALVDRVRLWRVLYLAALLLFGAGFAAGVVVGARLGWREIQFDAQIVGLLIVGTVLVALVPMAGGGDGHHHHD